MTIRKKASLGWLLIFASMFAWSPAAIGAEEEATEEEAAADESTTSPASSKPATPAANEAPKEAVSAGPLLEERKRLYDSIQKAGQEGIGVSGYLNAFSLIEKAVSEGQPQEAISKQTERLANDLEKQVTQRKLQSDNQAMLDLLKKGLLGNWQFMNGFGWFYANGTCRHSNGGSGKWYLDANRTLRITWDNGWFNTLQLKTSAYYLKGFDSTNPQAQSGRDVWAVKLPEPSDVVVEKGTEPTGDSAKKGLQGHWQFMNGFAWFYSNGTCRHGNGGSGKWNLDANKTLRITWDNGWFNTLQLTKVGGYLHGFDSTNPQAKSGRDVWAVKLPEEKGI